MEDDTEEGNIRVSIDPHDEGQIIIEIEEVTGNITVNPTSIVEKKVFSITCNGTGCTVTADNNVEEIEYGSSIHFNVIVNNYYHNPLYSITVGGTPIDFNSERIEKDVSGDGFTIRSITGDVDVSVTASEIQYEITLGAQIGGNDANGDKYEWYKWESGSGVPITGGTLNVTHSSEPITIYCNSLDAEYIIDSYSNPNNICTIQPTTVDNKPAITVSNFTGNGSIYAVMQSNSILIQKAPSYSGFTTEISIYDGSAYGAFTIISSQSHSVTKGTTFKLRVTPTTGYYVETVPSLSGTTATFSQV